MLKVGDLFPPFKLIDERGEMITEAALKGALVVLFFYPKDETPGCTKEACAFRDGLDAFTERGARVMGVSPDDQVSHWGFKQKYKLNFPLLTDHGHALASACGLWGEQVVYGHRFEGVSRTTYVLVDGRVAVIFEDVDVTAHVERVLAALPLAP
ncbi:peroxiredoxin [Myxococcota bacterium]|nr:peroxiredoxin [Myxococcota bacterium]MBU1431493.1 peroxiredoxin [Myxococcota bacterium]MBU1900617.1 peroxiredoxin [Myxococcota bacterium]